MGVVVWGGRGEGYCFDLFVCWIYYGCCGDVGVFYLVLL